MSDILGYNDLIRSLDEKAEETANSYKRFFRAIAAGAYNLGQIDAMQGVWGFKESAPKDDVTELVKRLWEEDGK